MHRRAVALAALLLLLFAALAPLVLADDDGEEKRGKGKGKGGGKGKDRARTDDRGEDDRGGVLPPRLLDLEPILETLLPPPEERTSAEGLDRARPDALQTPTPAVLPPTRDAGKALAGGAAAVLGALVVAGTAVGGAVAAGFFLRRRRRLSGEAAERAAARDAAEADRSPRARALEHVGGALLSTDGGDLVRVAPGAGRAAAGRGCAYARSFLAAWYSGALGRTVQVEEEACSETACLFRMRT